MAPNSSFDNKHVTLLHSLLLPTDSLDTSKCWWHINIIIHTVDLSSRGYRPVGRRSEMQGTLLPPGGQKEWQATPSNTELNSLRPPGGTF